MRNAIGILKHISQGEEDIKHGRTKTQEEVFKNIEMLLATIKKKDNNDGKKMFSSISVNLKIE